MIQIDRACEADLPAIEALLVACGLPTDGLAAHLGGALVARAEGVVVGSAALELYGGEAALLRSVAVAPAWRAAGVARQLIVAVAQLASAHGVAQLYLLTTTAEGYFPRYGFTRVAREQVPAALAQSVEFTSACPLSATVMVGAVSPLL
ncbi:GNAT family N-acetyltransferase [Chloroflexia bacterium SDU3-3]|nr:GNAT family N-acetyltransferase [Chloroflexia bacterium SDU3-3]